MISILTSSTQDDPPKIVEVNGIWDLWEGKILGVTPTVTSTDESLLQGFATLWNDRIFLTLLLGGNSLWKVYTTSFLIFLSFLRKFYYQKNSLLKLSTTKFLDFDKTDVARPLQIVESFHNELCRCILYDIRRHITAGVVWPFQPTHHKIPNIHSIPSLLATMDGELHSECWCWNQKGCEQCVRHENEVCTSQFSCRRVFVPIPLSRAIPHH